MKIHQVKTRLSNSYVIEEMHRGEPALFVVDVAVACHRYVLGFIESDLNYPINSVKAVAFTHDDPDHFGGILALSALCGAAVFSPYASRRSMHKFFNDPAGVLTRIGTSTRELFRARSRAMYLNRSRDKAARAAPKFIGGSSSGIDNVAEIRRLKNNDSVPGFADWTLLHTPGHSWDSCCFYHPSSKSIITGDTLLGSGPQQRVVVPAIYANRKQMQGTLGRLAALDIEHIYPGHGSVISDPLAIANEARAFSAGA
ncbi:MAG: MBL fold metallo-hydrolase [Zhongshania sp.]|nr:MBL fold metallo-hydrolase [Zhongshania sp.]